MQVSSLDHPTFYYSTMSYSMLHLFPTYIQPHQYLRQKNGIQYQIANTIIFSSYTDNVEVYERSSPLKLLLEDSRVKLPTAAAYSLLPVPLKALFILMTMAHSLHRLPRGTEKEVFIRARSAIAYWTYLVVHALNEDIAAEKTRTSDGTMTSVMMLLLADVS